MLAFLLQGATLGFSAAVSPGGFQAFLFAQTAQGGFRRAWPSAFAPLISDGPIIALVLIVLTQAPTGLLRGLHIAGGLFLLYLAWGALRSFQSYSASSVPAPTTTGRSLGKAVVTNGLSPGPYISGVWWLARFCCGLGMRGPCKGWRFSMVLTRRWWGHCWR